MKPKKSLGQNFLKDPKILKKIADFAKIEKGDTVVEVGPGEGTLTKFLLERASKVIVIEKDDFLADQLKNRFPDEILNSRLQIINSDALEIENLLKIAKLEIENYVLVGNIPYYITGALFKKALEAQNPPKSLCFVVQKEVAERIMVGDGKESILSISIKAYGTPEYGGTIKAGSFYPAPKVDSGIIAIRGINKARFSESGVSEKAFFEIINAGFAHKRKFLQSNLKSLSGNFGKEVGNVFEQYGIPPKARAEDLKVEDWFNISKSFSN